MPFRTISSATKAESNQVCCIVMSRQRDVFSASEPEQHVSKLTMACPCPGIGKVIRGGDPCRSYGCVAKRIARGPNNGLSAGWCFACANPFACLLLVPGLVNDLQRLGRSQATWGQLHVSFADEKKVELGGLRRRTKLDRHKSRAAFAKGVGPLSLFLWSFGRTRKS